MRSLFVICLFLRACLAVFVNYISILFRSTLDGPHPGDRSISADWLTKVLRRSCAIEVTDNVIMVQPESLSGNRGLAGEMSRLRVDYRPRGSAPQTFVLKMTKEGFSGRRVTLAGGRHREAWFYSSNYASDRAIATLLPRVYYSYGSPVRAESVVLLEDLKERPFSVGVNMVMGNQIWGVPEGSVNPPRDPLVTLEMIFTRAADIHAKYWRDPNLHNTDWLKCSGWYKGKNRSEWEQGIKFARDSWSAIVANFRAGKSKVNLSEKLVRWMNDSFEATSWERMQQHLRDPRNPFTFCHGDFHASNMMIWRADVNAEDQLLLFDWSEVGPWEGTTDLAQMVISDLRMSVWRPHARRVVRVYWDRLIANGVSAQEYPFEQCFSAFCRGGAEKWAWFLSILAGDVMFPGLPAAASQYFHDQVLAWIEEYQLYPSVAMKPVVCLP